MAMVCEICGSTDLVKQEGFFVCQNCGTKYTVEEARKLLGNVPTADVARPVAPQQSSADQELKNLYQVARRARDDNNGETAEKYYDMIQIKDPNSWEAAFYTVYFKAMECKIAQIRSAAISVSNCEDTVLGLIKDHVPAEEQMDAVREVLVRSQTIANMLYNGAENHYNGIDASIQSKYTQELLDNCSAARDIMYTCGTHIDGIFADTPEIAALSADAWKAGIKMHEKLLPRFANKQLNQTIIDSYAEKVGQYDPAFAEKYRYAKYTNKKEELNLEIKTLKNTIEETEKPLTFKLGGCSIFFLVLGIGALLFAIIIRAIMGDDISLALILFEAVAGIGCIIFALYYSIPKMAQKEARERKNAEAKEQLAKKEAELKNLEKSRNS